MPRRFDEAALNRLRSILETRPAIEISAPQYRRAAVLIALIRNGNPEDHDEWSVLFTRRSEQLMAHSGQIAFPGGSVEAGEALEHAVLREAEEEVGIPRTNVEVIGRMDDVITNSGFLVAPFVGIVSGNAGYVMQEGEVTEIFEVPLSVLMAPSNPEVRYVVFRERNCPAYFFHHGPYEIWGLTGRMLKAFLDLVWQSL